MIKGLSVVFGNSVARQARKMVRSNDDYDNYDDYGDAGVAQIC